MAAVEVSIIIPTFERPASAEEAIQSVHLAVNNELPYEIILVDDGSSDPAAASLAAICKSHRNCRYIRQPSNMGPQAARNVGLEAAAGRFVKFLDSDDLLLPGALADECQTLSKLDRDILVSGWLISNTDAAGEQVVKKAQPKPYTGNPFDAILAGFGAQTAAVLYTRSAIGDARWDSAVTHPDDWLFLIRVLLNDPLVSVRDEPVSIWRQHSGPRQSATALIDYARSRFFIMDFLQQVMLERNELSGARRQALAEYFYRDIYVAHRFDKAQYQKILTRLEDLVPGFEPSSKVESNWVMQRFGKFLGYRRYVPLHNLLRRIADKIGLLHGR